MNEWMKRLCFGQYAIWTENLRVMREERCHEDRELQFSLGDSVYNPATSYVATWCFYVRGVSLITLREAYYNPHTPPLKVL